MRLSAAAILALLVPQADRMNYYAVSGHSAAEVRSAMNRVRPTTGGGLRVDGWTTWDIHWTFRYKPGPAGCVLTAFDVTLATTMTLPKWSDLPSAPAPLQNQWNTYYAALLQHEKGHVRIAELAVGAIREAGSRITTARCADIGAEVNRTGQALLAEFKKKEVQYDAETNHGVKQGARFP